MPLEGPKITRVMANFAKAIEQGSAETVKRSAEVAKAEQLRRMRADSGGDLKLSGVNAAKGRAGNAKINAKYKLTKGTGGSATALITAEGPLQIINNDTSGHVIRSAWGAGTRGGRGGRGTRGFTGPVLPGQFGGGGRGGKAVLNTPFGFRRSVRHPGTKGKQTWQLGRRDAEPKIRTSMSKRTTAVIAKGMKA